MGNETAVLSRPCPNRHSQTRGCPGCLPYTGLLEKSRGWGLCPRQEPSAGQGTVSLHDFCSWWEVGRLIFLKRKSKPPLLASEPPSLLQRFHLSSEPSSPLLPIESFWNMISITLSLVYLPTVAPHCFSRSPRRDPRLKPSLRMQEPQSPVSQSLESAGSWGLLCASHLIVKPSDAQRG